MYFANAVKEFLVHLANLVKVKVLGGPVSTLDPSASIQGSRRGDVCSATPVIFGFKSQTRDDHCAHRVPSAVWLQGQT